MKVWESLAACLDMHHQQVHQIDEQTEMGE